MKRYSSKIFLIPLLFLIVSFSHTVYAAPKVLPKIIIGTELNDYKKLPKNQCSILIPKQYKTIQAGIDAARSGDTVCVRRGIYKENLNIRKTIRLSGSGANKSILVGQTTDPTIYIAGDGNANNVVVEGFTIKGVASVDNNRNDPTVFNIGPFASGIILRYNRIVAGDSQLVVRADSGQNNDLIAFNVLVGQNSPAIFKVSGVQGPAGKVDFLNNEFSGTVSSTVQNFSGSGTILDTWGTNSLIQRNVFNTSGTPKIIIASAYASNTISENNLNSNAIVKIGVYSSGTLSAENNWWGDLDPTDNTHGDVDFTPFSTTPYKVK